MMSVLTKWFLQLIKECYCLKLKETISMLVTFKVSLNKVSNSQVIKSVVTTVISGTRCIKAHILYYTYNIENKTLELS